MDFVSSGDLSAAFGLMRDAFIRRAGVEAVLKAADWRGSGPFEQDISVPQASGSALSIVGLSDTATQAQREACREALLSPKLVSDGMMRIYADGTKPAVDLPVSVMTLY